MTGGRANLMSPRAPSCFVQCLTPTKSTVMDPLESAHRFHFAVCNTMMPELSHRYAVLTIP